MVKAFSEGYEFKSQYSQAVTVVSLSKTLNCSVVSCLNCKSLWIIGVIQNEQHCMNTSEREKGVGVDASSYVNYY